MKTVKRLVAISLGIITFIFLLSCGGKSKTIQTQRVKEGCAKELFHYPFFADPTTQICGIVKKSDKPDHTVDVTDILPLSCLPLTPERPYPSELNKKARQVCERVLLSAVIPCKQLVTELLPNEFAQFAMCFPDSSTVVSQ